MRLEGYTTAISEDEWYILQTLVPPPRWGGRRRDVDMRQILDAAFYRHCTGCSWRRLPPTFPPWQTVYTYVRQWQLDGTWERMLATLEKRDGHTADSAARDGRLHELPTTTLAREAAAKESPMRLAG